MRFIFVEKVWHMGAMSSKDCPGSETKLGRKWSSVFGKERMAPGTNNSQGWEFLLQSELRIRAQLKLNWPPLSWETGDCSNSVEMAPVNQCSPVQYFRIHSFQDGLHSDNSKERSFARQRCLFKLSQLQSRWQSGQVSVWGPVLRFIVTSA